MGSIFSSFISADSIRSVASYVSGEAKYIWGLEGNLDALQTEIDKLIQTQDDLLNKVVLAEKKPRTRRTFVVKGWLARVQKLETKIAKQQDVRDEEIDSLCLGGFCSKHLKSSYDFGREVVTLRDQVINLRREGENLEAFTARVPEGAAPEDAAVAVAVEPAFVGRELLLEQIWKWIRDEEKNSGNIGLYGTGGVGKTTILKQINNNFLNQPHNFDVVIWAVVSRQPNLEKLQVVVGERIGLSSKSWQERSFEEKALDISNILSRRRFVLLLDDLWKPIDLTELGIPLQTLKYGSKILFTTRSLEVCGQMNAAMLKVSCLADAEAWKLFQEDVGTYALDCDPRIPELPRTMAKECGGLPLALKTVGRVMASISNPQEWQSKIKILRTTASKFSGMEKVFTCLKFSYDNLAGDELRACLLYCCLFPEDSQISKVDLMNFWISEGITDDFDYNTVLGELIRACLLEVEGDQVKMHDMIREMALWIAQKIDEDEEKFLVHAGVGLTVSPEVEEWERVKRISFIENKIGTLPKILNCPNLFTLLLDGNKIEEINDGFFQSMHSLRVLSLADNNINKLPSGISSLVSLHYLDLSGNLIHKLPLGLKALVNLRYLNLEENCISRIPHLLISSFSELQVLKIMRAFSDDAAEEEGNLVSDDAEALMKELLSLKHLNLISLTLNGSSAFRNFLEYPNLMSSTQSLSIIDCQDAPINVLNLLDKMENLDELYIDGSNLEEFKIGSITRDVHRVFQIGFHCLGMVFIDSCTVTDLTWLAFLPNLKLLKIDSCDKIEKIINAERLNQVSEIMGEQHNLFGQLEYLLLYSLENLKSVYMNPLPFPVLKEITVYGCHQLKRLPLNSHSSKNRKLVIEGGRRWWEALEWEDEATQTVFSTCFIDPLLH